MLKKLYTLQADRSLTDIVQGCIEAKKDCQKEFYKMFYGFSMAICMRYCSNNENAMEVVNDGFLKIFRQLHNFTPVHANFEKSLRGWMKTIFINTSIDHFRRNRSDKYVSEITENESENVASDEDSINKLSYKELLETVQKLSPIYRAVFNLHVIDGLKHEEIARQLNISVGTSKSNLFKARISIQKLLKKQDQNFYERKVG
ncbi:sigma-70 family RNA polymerase sigma factor [Ferruginibacter lapsinanis]|uniref:RNA polymerase sigma factor n=1 Tax=Ferruginibacter lapsinanis TaxID=563172 RepID=UPI001E30B9C8|nr:sigma-70 family RNA polymerase sigma factor [Ferruginibacter lapsinanis]UEG49512.1 sigma-70 family RNA polymerase sigma factor [Ferruginibacter lapsinanis]